MIFNKLLLKLFIFIGAISVLIIGLEISPLANTTEENATLSARTSSEVPPTNVDITLQQIASGLSSPVQITHAGDGSNRLFVVEQTGRIKILKNGTVTGTFLDLGSSGSGLDRIDCCGERGLLSVAFHPNYENNGYFFVNYTDDSGGDTKVARYSVSANPDVANTTETLLLEINQPASNHNGGQLMFGPDGYLYIGMGDGGSGGDPWGNAQKKNKLLGAMLRIDVDSGPGNAPDTTCDSDFTTGSNYTIPTGTGGNPFVDGAGGDCDEIWAIGLRNPWRFSFDRTNGDLYIGDVGQGSLEEISFQAGGTAGGLNFGWDCKEGTSTFSSPAPECSNPGPLTDPVAEYGRSLGQAVSGGYVYRGSLYPNLRERYFYADYATGNLWTLYKSGNSWINTLEFDANLNVSSFGEDESGELYLTSLSGSVYQITDSDGPSPVLISSTKKASRTHLTPGDTVTYTIKLQNSGGLVTETLQLTDTIPTGLGYVPGTFTATAGTVDDSLSPTLKWTGTAETNAITLTYRVTATGQISGSIANYASLTGQTIDPLNMSEDVFVSDSVLTSTITDFFLPGTQPGTLTDEIPDPDDCDSCHTAPIYNAWRGSMMSQAGRDPLFWAALTVANNHVPNAGEFCLRCHMPKGWLEGRSHPADGDSLQSIDISNGVACEVCHRMVDPVASTSATDQAKGIDADIRTALTSTVPMSHTGSAMLIIDPEDRRRGPFDVDPQHGAWQTDFLGQDADPITESRVCGSCHNIDNPLLSWDGGQNQYWPNDMDTAAPSFGKGHLFPLERTYDEWLNSEYAASGVVAPKFAGAKPDGRVSSCQDCHMPRTTGTAANGGVNRNCVNNGCLPEHQLVGGNTWVPQILQDTRWRLSSIGDSAELDATTLNARSMLQKAATVTVTLSIAPGPKTATVRITNDTGHKLPTGYPEGRRMWLNLKAYDENGTLLVESGRYTETTGELADDSQIKVYEVKQGLTPELAPLLDLSAGASFHFALNNTVLKDNRIPPRGYTQAAFNQPGLMPVGATYTDGQYWDDTQYTLPEETARVVAMLYYQTASKEYIDFLRTNGGADGATLGTLWDDSKSPPEIMAVAFDPVIPNYLPVIFK